MFQLYHHGDRGWVSELLKRVESLGYKAVALTVDTQHYSRRERDTLARWSPRKAMEIAPNPRGPFHDYQMRLTWADVEWLMKTTKLPVGLKGILTVADARRAAEMGVRLIWVSNHGGRQLDHTQSSIEALPPIVDAVAGRAEIVIDGGFSKGTDVIKGLARGAKVVMLGRTALWGLAADGAEGVARVFEILRDQLHVAMGLCGPDQDQRPQARPDLQGRLVAWGPEALKPPTWGTRSAPSPPRNWNMATTTRVLNESAPAAEYAQLEERIIARDQKGASDVLTAPAAGAPCHRDHARDRAHPRAVHARALSPAARRRPRQVRQQRSLSPERAGGAPAGVDDPSGAAGLPMAQTVWYMPTGLDPWNQLIGKAPGHYTRLYDIKVNTAPPMPEAMSDQEPLHVEGTPASASITGSRSCSAARCSSRTASFWG